MVEPAKRPTLRDIKEQFRMERHGEFLATALKIVTTEGLPALTMQGLADTLDCGIGTLYRHFPSKGALVAELQREALDIINTSFRLSLAHLEELLGARSIDDAATVALAKAYTAGQYWICAERSFPQEVDLCRRMFIDPDVRLEADEANRVLPAAMRLLDRARGLLDDAESAGALRAGSAVHRAVIVIAGTTGVLMTSELDHWAPDLFHGRDLSSSMLRDLFLGWGADPARLELVDELVAELDEADNLVPAVRR